MDNRSAVLGRILWMQLLNKSIACRKSLCAFRRAMDLFRGCLEGIRPKTCFEFTDSLPLMEFLRSPRSEKKLMSVFQCWKAGLSGIILYIATGEGRLLHAFGHGEESLDTTGQDAWLKGQVRMGKPFGRKAPQKRNSPARGDGETVVQETTVCG